MRQKVVYLVTSLRLAAVEETLAQKEDSILMENLLEENSRMKELLCLERELSQPTEQEIEEALREEERALFSQEVSFPERRSAGAGSDSTGAREYEEYFNAPTQMMQGVNNSSEGLGGRTQHSDMGGELAAQYEPRCSEEEELLKELRAREYSHSEKQSQPLQRKVRSNEGKKRSSSGGSLRFDRGRNRELRYDEAMEEDEVVLAEEGNAASRNKEIEDEEFLENLKEMIAKQFDGKKGCREDEEEGSPGSAEESPIQARRNYGEGGSEGGAVSEYLLSHGG